MEKEYLAAIIALGVICALSGLMAWMTKYHPPRQINWLYGYRTSRSMRTPATWHEANHYFANYFWRISCTMPILAIVAYWTLGGSQAILVVLIGWVLVLIIGLVRTEKRLKLLFDEEGKARA
jgi:hypothetical protein